MKPWNYENMYTIKYICETKFSNVLCSAQESFVYSLKFNTGRSSWKPPHLAITSLSGKNIIIKFIGSGRSHDDRISFTVILFIVLALGEWTKNHHHHVRVLGGFFLDLMKFPERIKLNLWFIHVTFGVQYLLNYYYYHYYYSIAL